MSDAALATASLATVAARLKKKEISPVEVTNAVLDRIAAVDGKVKAYVTVTADEARQAARAAETEIAAGRYRGPLHGIPIGVKDLFYTRGVKTTARAKLKSSASGRLMSRKRAVEIVAPEREKPRKGRHNP